MEPSLFFGRRYHLEFNVMFIHLLDQRCFTKGSTRSEYSSAKKMKQYKCIKIKPKSNVLL